MYNAQAQQLLKGVKIAIMVEQGMLTGKAEGGDETINRPAHSQSPSAKPTVISGGGDRKLRAPSRENLKLQELAADLRKPPLTPNTLQDFAEDQIREAQPLASHLHLQPSNLGCTGSLQVIHPDCGIDDDHGLKLPSLARRASHQDFRPIGLSRAGVGCLSGP